MLVSISCLESKKYGAGAHLIKNIVHFSPSHLMFYFRPLGFLDDVNLTF